MTNPTQTTIPYSAEAVDNLVKVEREHYERLFTNHDGIKDKMCGYINCYHILIDKYVPNRPYPANIYPCPTLVKARAKAAVETRVAVALIIAGDNK